MCVIYMKTAPKLPHAIVTEMKMLQFQLK